MSHPIRLRQFVLAAAAILATMALWLTGVGLPSAWAAPPPEVPKKLIAEDFPDPDLVRVGNTWYAYATNNSRHVPVASAPTIDGPWTVRGDAMPGGPSPARATAGFTWAPDVFRNPDDTLTHDLHRAAHRRRGSSASAPHRDATRSGRSCRRARR